MNIEIGFTSELTNTRFAPLAALSALYQQQKRFKTLSQIEIPMQKRHFEPSSKLIQVLLSILAGCETLSEVNSILKQEKILAAVWGWDRFADQSSLSRTLDVLTQKNIESLRGSIGGINQEIGQLASRDWRKFLWLDFDLSGLPCGSTAQESLKGYFSDKKTSMVVN